MHTTFSCKPTPMLPLHTQGEAGTDPYRMPMPGELRQYTSFFSRLPLTETPEMFGLHPNALITRNLQDTKLMLDSLLATMSQVRLVRAAVNE